MTDSGSGTSPIEVTQLAGPGVSGMEDDIPLYHFDVSPEEMQELIADPDGFVVRLGLRPDEDHEYGKVNLRLAGPSSDDPDGGTPPDGGTSHSCCYISGESEMTCHTHLR
jgi:hypothetical protein